MKKTIRDFDLNNKRVIIRCDFNVPIKEGIIVDDNRIVKSLKTINYAISQGAKVILLSHLGKIKSLEDKNNKSLKIVSDRLTELLNKDVTFIASTRGNELEQSVSDMKPGDVLLIENTRFEDFPDKLESGNSEELGKYWAGLGDIFINDAFGTSHRAHASNVGIASYIPSGIGLLIENEINNLSVLNNPSKPYVVILGGAKISDKIEIVSSLVSKADKILIGGGMMFTFLKAMGYKIGASICDNESIDFAKKMLKLYGDKIVVAMDSITSKEFSDNNDYEEKKIDDFMDDDIGLDIGSNSISLFKDNLKNAKTVFWNGTLGYSEFKNYSNGTREILKYITGIPSIDVVLGGGDTVAASAVMGYKDKVGFASTGGGATLEYISGKKLPGIEIIDNKE